MPGPALCSPHPRRCRQSTAGFRKIREIKNSSRNGTGNRDHRPSGEGLCETLLSAAHTARRLPLPLRQGPLPCKLAGQADRHAAPHRPGRLPRRAPPAPLSLHRDESRDEHPHDARGQARQQGRVAQQAPDALAPLPAAREPPHEDRGGPLQLLPHGRQHHRQAHRRPALPHGQ